MPPYCSFVQLSDMVSQQQYYNVESQSTGPEIRSRQSTIAVSKGNWVVLRREAVCEVD